MGTGLEEFHLGLEWHFSVGFGWRVYWELLLKLACIIFIFLVVGD
jgi:hypothetical protein